MPNNIDNDYLWFKEELQNSKKEYLEEIENYSENLKKNNENLERINNLITLIVPTQNIPLQKILFRSLENLKNDIEFNMQEFALLQEKLNNINEAITITNSDILLQTYNI